MEKEDIEKYYKKYNEDIRLRSAYGILEEEHLRRIILKNIPSSAIEVFDIGGGTGHYSTWLASLGFSVHYSDIVPQHVEIFNARNGRQSGIATSCVQDARSLTYDDDCADIVLLNGPLYHLTDRNDRLKTLREAKRILRKDGQLLAVTIGRFAGLQYALTAPMIYNDEYYYMVAEEINSGIRKNKTPEISTFDVAYFHTDMEIKSEMRESGFRVSSTLGIVGMSSMIPTLESDIADKNKLKRLLAVAELTERFPALSPKMFTSGTK